MQQIFKKISRWMDYNPPGALTSKGWRLFKKEFKEKAPIRYWIKNDFKYKVIMSFVWKYKSAKDWIRYRTYDRYHIVDTGLKPGYQDSASQMFHASFTVLKDFVEVELAWCRYHWSDERKTASFWEKHLPFYRMFNPFRSRKLGLDYLNWASTLDDPSLPPNERCDHQAISSREIRELYLWWTDIRPNRKLKETPGYDNQGLGILSVLDDDFDKDAKDFVDYSKIFEENSKLEEEWQEEDTEMFIRLVKVRGHMWT